MDAIGDSPVHYGYAQGLNLAVSLCLTYTLCIILIRWWIRKGQFGIDDIVVLGATVLSLSHTAADYVALANGLGKPWSEVASSGALPRIQDSTIAGVILFWIALYASKAAVLTFLVRMTKARGQLRTYYIGIVLISVLGFISVLLASANCPSADDFYWSFFNNQRTCPSQTARWHVLTAFDVMTEVFLLVLPLQLVWNLQMPLKKKAVVVAAFWLRLPVIILSVVREVFTTRLNTADTDPSYGGALVVVLMEVELAYAIAANTLSALKAFTESFNSSFGQGFTRGKGSQYDMSGLSKGSSSGNEKRKSGSMLKSLSSMKGPHVGARDVAEPDRGQSPNSFMKLRPEHDGGHVARVSVEPARAWRREVRTPDGERVVDDMVIMRETELSIHHDQAPMLRDA